MIISECIESNNLDEFSVYAVLDRKVAVREESVARVTKHSKRHVSYIY